MEEKWISVDEELPKQRKHEGNEDVLIAIRYKYDLPEEKEKIEKAFYSFLAKVILGGGFGILCGIVGIIFWSLAEHLN